MLIIVYHVFLFYKFDVDIFLGCFCRLVSCTFGVSKRGRVGFIFSVDSYVGRSGLRRVQVSFASVIFLLTGAGSRVRPKKVKSPL